MDFAYVSGRLNFDIILPDEFIEKLPKSVCLFMTAQAINQFDSVKKQLEKMGISVEKIKTRHTYYEGQIYGCSTNKYGINSEAFLFVGDGFFHPSALLFNNDKKVYVYDPINKKDMVYTQDEIKDLLNKRKAAYVKFLSSENIGVIVTTKLGQNRMSFAEKLKEKYPDKNFYLFLTETLDFLQLENFPYVDIWVNTMCPRIGLDDIKRTEKMIINIEDVSEFFF